MPSEPHPPHLHQGQVDVDEQLVRALISAQFPAWADRDIRAVPSGGTENYIFRLGEDLAVRMPIQPGAVSSLVKEARWLSTVAPHLSLEVPAFVETGEPDAGYPFPWAVTRWIPGRDAHAEPPTSLEDAARRLAGFVTELRAVDASDAPPTGSPGFGRGGPLSDRDHHMREALGQSADLIDAALVEKIWDDALAAPNWDGSSVWIHADLLPTNLLVRDGRLAGVLDFGTLSVGDPAYDATAAWHVFEPTSREQFLHLVEADAATRRRARGLVVSGAVIALSYYRNTNPIMVAVARRGLEQVLLDDS